MTHHAKLPFQVSPKAVKHIREWSRPKRALRATMMFASADTEYDEHGNVVASFDGEHLLVGYHKPRQVSKWTEFEIGGYPILISAETLVRLGGKKLILRRKAGCSDICSYVLVAA